MLTSCTKGSSGVSAEEFAAEVDQVGALPASTAASDCGVVVEGALQNPPDSAEAIIGHIAAAEQPDLVVVQPSNPSMGPLLVKLLGVEPSGRSGASERIQAIAPPSHNIFLYPAGTGCDTVTPGGGVGVLGTIVLADGRVLSEILLEEGLLLHDSGRSVCSSSLVTGCYEALEVPLPKLSGQTVSNFLWKPRSERDGDLVVLLNPYGATIVVNGTTLANSGPSNGRGTTARGSRPGCAYGRATVEVFNSRGEVVTFPGGKESYTIENGCDRVEF